MNAIRPTACWLASLFAFLPAGFAQEPPPTAAVSDAVTLEELPAFLKKLDDEIARKLDEVRALVDSEAKAGNLTGPIAQSLRWSLRTTASVGSAVDVRGLVSTMRVPTDNTALTQAIKELEATYVAAQTQRTLAANAAAREVRRRVAESVRSATKPEDLLALETTFAAANEALRRQSGVAAGEFSNAFTGADQLLRGVRRLMQAEISGKPAALGQAISQLRNDYRYDQGNAYENEVQARIERVRAPFAAAAEKAENDVAAAILNAKPAAEIDAALARLEETAEQLSLVNAGQMAVTGRDLRQTANSYRSLARALRELDDWEGENLTSRFNDARNATRQLGTKRAAEMDAMISKVEAQIKESAAKMAAERGDNLAPRIAAAKQPADLDAIVADLRSWSASASRSNSTARDNWRTLAGQLSILSASWATANPALLQQIRSGDNEGARAPFAGELADLHKRVERDVLSRILQAPELNTPPLADKPLETAMDSFCDALAKAGEWRRLFDVLNARGSLQTGGGRRLEDDPVNALRSYFTAQNLELAELWADAAQAYKAVLRSTSQLAPIKPAAERLKVLTKEHPELSPAPKEGAPSVSPEQ